MANSAALVKEGLITANTRYKLYKLTLENTDTDVVITPGAGYNNPVGTYTKYTESSGTFTFTVVDAAGAAYGSIVFYA